jgi:hypothetical protein
MGPTQDGTNSIGLIALRPAIGRQHPLQQVDATLGRKQDSAMKRLRVAKDPGRNQ